MPEDYVSIYVVSHNRYEQLKHCVESFFATNMYPKDKIELIIIDNASTDSRVIDYIENLQPDCDNYKYQLNKENDYPYCMKIAKNQARRLASGDYIIDSPDDHAFVAKTDWIRQSIDFLKNNEKVGCVIHYAYPDRRLNKKRSQMTLVNENIFRSELSGYSDYNIMDRKTIDKFGDMDETLGHESEATYMKEFLRQGYRRYMLKYPPAVPNDQSVKLPFKHIDEDEYKRLFSSNKRTVSAEQIRKVCYGLR